MQAIWGWILGHNLVNATPPKAPLLGRLIAWDAVHQKEAWRRSTRAVERGDADDRR